MPPASDVASRSNVTLQAKHEYLLNSLETEASKVPELRSKLEKIEGKINRIKKKKAKTEKDRIESYSLERQSETLRQKISALTENQESIEYCLKAMPYLYKYYDSGNDFNKADIYEEFLHSVNPKELPRTLPTNKHPNWCDKCDREKIFDSSEGIIVCHGCGITEYAIVEDSKQSYSDGHIAMTDSNYFSYKKITHFKECIDQCQGRERTVIPKEVFVNLLEKIKKERINDPSKLTQKKIKEYLRDLGYNKYYEHSSYILAKLNGQANLTIPPEIVTRLESMFKAVHGAFKNVRPEDRKNFPSYSYVLHKCIELIGTCDYLLPNFVLLKSDNKLRNIDRIWEQICNELKWQFIPSK